MATYSSVISNIFSNQTKIDSKISEYINIKNAVKLLDNYSNWNGYIKLYTEITSNFEIDDIVYISYTEPLPLPAGVFNLANSSTPYAEWSMGYKVININKSKNEVVINREYNDVKPGALLSNQFISRVSVRSGTFTRGVIDGLVFYNANIFSGVTFTQGVFKYCNISDIIFDDKYSDVKVLYSTNTFTSKFARNKSTNATVYKTKRYWYNIIDNCTLNNCNIRNGKFDNSTLIGTGTNYITEGEFDNCTISGYTINGGIFRDCIIESNCDWNYGTWQNINGTTDFRANWINGIWNSGNFIGKVWSGGTFNAGVFSAATWKNGTVNAGDFYSANWLSGLVRSGNFYNSNWTSGTFNSGIFENSTWTSGYFNNGTFLGSTFVDGNVQGGIFTGSTISGGKVYKGMLNDVTIDNGGFYGSYNIKDSTINNATIHQGTIQNTNIYGGEYYNGYYSNVTFLGGDITIYNGQYKDCSLSNLTVKNGNFVKCTADNVPFYNGIFTEGWYENGYWYGGIWNGLDTTGTFKSDVFLGGDFYGGYFSGDTKISSSWTAIWSGGTFHYGYFKGQYRTTLPIYPYPKWNYTQQTGGAATQ